MNRDQAEGYAREWAAAWNARDLDAVLAHFDDAVVFSSPKAVRAMGVPTVRGKAALRAYWQRALSRIESLRFTVERVIWDPATAELAIVYDREVNGEHDRAAEILHFGGDGRVGRGEVLYGVGPGDE
jgi:hypothetical protein